MSLLLIAESFQNPCESKSIEQPSVHRQNGATHEENEYPCNQCNNKSTTRNQLKSHIMSVHESNQYPCNQCDYIATTRNQLKNHKSSVHENNQTSIKDFLRNIRNNLEHINTDNHNQDNEIENDEITNENENKNETCIISTQEMIDDARARRNLQTSNMKCDQCNFKTGSKTLLQRHSKESHEKEKSKKSKPVSKRISCKTCTRKFNKTETYDRHIEKCQNSLDTQNQPSQDIITRSMRNKSPAECTGP